MSGMSESGRDGEGVPARLHDTNAMAPQVPLSPCSSGWTVARPFWCGVLGGENTVHETEGTAFVRFSRMYVWAQHCLGGSRLQDRCRSTPSLVH
jgi:hypothetical protein